MNERTSNPIFRFFPKTPNQSIYMRHRQPNAKHSKNISRKRDIVRPNKHIQEKSTLESRLSNPPDLARMHLLQPRTTLVQRPIDSSSDRQSSADNGADADEEAREGL